MIRYEGKEEYPSKKADENAYLQHINDSYNPMNQ